MKKEDLGKKAVATRVAWLERTLAKIPAGSRILDAGAGEQQFRKFCSHLEYVAQDFGRYEGVGDGRGLQTGSWEVNGLDIVSDITEIPEADGSFDAVMCTEVCEHLPDPIAAVKEFQRLLCIGGHLVITAPFCSWTHFAPYHFYTGFNRYFYEKHLEESGFEILELCANGNFFDYLWQEVRRAKRRAKQYADAYPNFLERLAIRVVLQMLRRFSSKDKGSHELLCFGYHVLARKGA